MQLTVKSGAAIPASTDTLALPLFKQDSDTTKLPRALARLDRSLGGIEIHQVLKHEQCLLVGELLFSHRPSLVFTNHCAISAASAMPSFASTDQS